MNDLTVPGSLESLDSIAQFVGNAAALANLTPKQSYRLRLAVDEIATNIVTHGYSEAGRVGEINIRAIFEIDHLVIILKDSGASYDPTQDYSSKEVHLPPEERSVSCGLGAFLAVKSVDQFQYERHTSHNLSTFIVQR